MEKKQDESIDVSPSKSALNVNWNARKHLVELEFELRSSTEESIEENAPRDELENARREEAEGRATFAKNGDQYEVLMTAWIGEAPRENLAPLI
jgi:hypothetical protein